MKTTIWVIVIIVIIFFGFLLFKGGEEKTPQNSSEENPIVGLNTPKQNSEKEETFDKVPSFSLEDIDGNTVSLVDFAGKTLVINSWAAWCPFCVDELADFGALQERFGDEIVMIAINRQESLNKTKKFTDDLGVTDEMLWLLDPKDSFYKSIGGFSMPETIFVDSNGNIRVHKRGPMDLSEMIEKVNSILNS